MQTKWKWNYKTSFKPSFADKCFFFFEVFLFVHFSLKRVIATSQVEKLTKDESLTCTEQQHVDVSWCRSFNTLGRVLATLSF